MLKWPIAVAAARAAGVAAMAAVVAVLVTAGVLRQDVAECVVLLVRALAGATAGVPGP